MTTIPQSVIQQLLNEPTNHTYNEFSIIGSSCQHIHVHRVDDVEFQFILHLITLVSVSSNLFSLFAIYFKTSKNMGDFKWCLLNLQFWIAATDSMLSFLVIPKLFFPIIGGRPVGILTFLGVHTSVQIYIGFGCFGAMVASVSVLFLYRQQATCGVDSRFKLNKTGIALIIGINYLIYVNMTVPMLLTAPDDQLASRIEILRTEPCPAKDLLHPDVFILQRNVFSYLPWYIFLLLFVAVECGLFAFHCFWILILSTMRQKLSKKTRMMQIKFFLALVFQIAIPTALCYAPIFYLLITTFLDHYWQFANDVCIFVFSTHGTISAICVLCFYECYRDYIMVLVCRRLSKNSTNGTSARNSVFVTSMV